MKWYSIKKFTPPTCSDLLLRIMHKNREYERFVIGMSENLNAFEDLSTWEYMINSFDFNLNDYYITHFCILDPVEIEE